VFSLNFTFIKSPSFVFIIPHFIYISVTLSLLQLFFDFKIEKLSGTAEAIPLKYFFELETSETAT